MRSHFHGKSLKKYKKSKKLWISSPLNKCIKERNKLYGKFVKTRGISILQEFRKVRNKLNADIKKDKAQYYKNKFNAIYNNPRKVWQAENELSSRPRAHAPKGLTIERVTYSGQSLVDKFNSHFLESGSSTMPTPRTPTCESYVRYPLHNSVFLAPTTALEITTIIKSLGNSGACGEDGLCSKPIKAVSSLISTPLSHICNLILSTGIFQKK